MNTKQRHELPAEVKDLRAQFEDWRQQRHKGERIPDNLWSAAGDAGRQYGVSQVCRALKLDYYHLKRKTGPENVEVASGPDPRALFVEWKTAPHLPAAREEVCVVELEKENGTRLRVRARDPDAVDWFRLKEAFLEA